MRASLSLMVLLAACEGQSANAPGNSPGSNGAAAVGNQVAVAVKASTPPTEPFSVEEENDLYVFSYSWPGSIPPKLESRFKEEMTKAKAELVAGAKEDRDERARQGFDYHPQAAQRGYEMAGVSPRLLSLASTSYGFTGGAHGSSGSGAILWDKALDREIAISDLVRPGTSWTGAIRQPFCVLLDREREKRRGEPVRKDDMFGGCPAYNEVTVLLQDTDKNWRFDHMLVTADQYIAGPYAEGPYEISLPITAKMIERLKPEYRLSFEQKPPVK